MADWRTEKGATGRAAAAARFDLSEIGRQLVVAAGGVASTMAVVWLNSWSAEQGGIDVLALTGFVVFPGGAIAGGIASASGYLLAARLTNTMPSRQLAWSMVLIALGAWMLNHWLSYAAAVVDGGYPSTRLGLWHFVVYKAEHTHAVLYSRGDPRGIDLGEMGRFGYVHESLQALGFMIGGLLTYRYLRRRETCSSCRRYARVYKVVTRVSDIHFRNGIERLGFPHPGLLMPGIADALRQAVGFNRFEMSLNVVRCPSCAANWLRPLAVVTLHRSEVWHSLGLFPVDAEVAQRVLNMSPIYRSQS